MPHIDAAGNPVNPTTENALKFEMFIFDALPLAQRWLVLEGLRAEEFAPVKNADGADSPATCLRAQSNLHGEWLQRIGVDVPRTDQGDSKYALEISPLFAFEADDLRGRVDPKVKIDGPTYWG